MNYITNNLIQIWKKVGDKPGWDISEQDKVVLLKSPTNIPNLNLAIIDGDCNQPDIIKQYFGSSSFGILQPKGRLNPLAKSAAVATEITEMHLAIDHLKSIELVNEVTVLKSSSELEEWCTVASKVFGYELEEIEKFYKTTYNLNRSQLLYYRASDDKIVGIGQIHVDDNDLVYISSIGVVEERRKKGIGQKIMNSCLLNGKNLGGKFYALHASESGELLYRKLGFKEVEKWSFCIL